MKRLKLIITTNSDFNGKPLCLFAMGDKIPKGVNIKVELIDGKLIKLSYKKLIEYIFHKPLLVYVWKSTNNRCLNFYNCDAIGRMYAIEPTLTINGKKRPIKRNGVDEYSSWEYKKKWDSKKWNIADTKELFTLSYFLNIQVSIKKNETYEIQFKIRE
jgi:hypothetical protein